MPKQSAEQHGRRRNGRYVAGGRIINLPIDIAPFNSMPASVAKAASGAKVHRFPLPSDSKENRRETAPLRGVFQNECKAGFAVETKKATLRSPFGFDGVGGGI